MNPQQSKRNPAKKLIFLDIDGTLIKSDQTSNDPHLPAKIQKLTRQGFLFGLNSNRSHEDVVEIYKKFNFSGPIILENGTYFLDKKKRVLLVKNPIKITPTVTTTLLKKFVSKEAVPAAIQVADSTKALKSKKISRTPLLLLANKFRLYTGSIHILRLGKRDKMIAEKLAIFLRAEFKRKKLPLTVVRSEASGNVIFYPKTASKGRALHAIRKYYPGYQIYMIGDDLNDLETLKFVDNFFAVGNATQEIKNKAIYAAKNEYTRGVSEILDLLK